MRFNLLLLSLAFWNDADICDRDRCRSAHWGFIAIYVRNNCDNHSESTAVQLLTTDNDNDRHHHDHDHDHEAHAEL